MLCELVLIFALLFSCLHVKECYPPVDWDLASGSVFLNYTYPTMLSVKFQLLCVRMSRQLIVHGMWTFTFTQFKH